MSFEDLTWKQAIKDHLESVKNPLIVVLGPTASGKTGFSIMLAEYINQITGKTAEVINADSRQMFTGMDIGTAKVSSEEMAGVPHHMLDVLQPDADINVAWYQRKAEQCIADILGRDHIPLLVGGSMLYIASITDGLSFDSDVRTELRSPNAECTYDLLIFGLGKERSEVVEKINNRTQKLFDAGWIDEVRRLIDDGYTKTDQGMKACGYREIVDFLTSGGDEAELREVIAAKTRQYARRQMTWWRGDTRILWL